jgi:hypothetical protein
VVDVAMVVVVATMVIILDIMAAHGVVMVARGVVMVAHMVMVVARGVTVAILMDQEADGIMMMTIMMPPHPVVVQMLPQRKKQTN